MEKRHSSIWRNRRLLFMAAFAMIVAMSPSQARAEKGVNVVQQQTKKVSGVVTDNTGEPVIGATVKVKGAMGGVITDIDGRYTIDAPQGSTLEISFLGFKTQEFVVGSSSQINVSLEEDAQGLDEVVVLGYGAAARKQDLSAAVGVVRNTEELATHPVSSTEAMLQGQLPGVTVQSDGGSPTSTPNVVIRGQGSQNGDNVLWVVDGVAGAPISSLNDIESIVVLKDAASAAIYGAQSGAGGVILVTTKKAKAGEPTLTYDGVYGVRSATNLPTPLNAEQELSMRQQSYANAGLTLPDGWNTSKNPWIATTRTNWMDEIFRDAFYQRHSVSLNGGTDKFSNRLSFSYDNNQGVLIDTYSKKLGIHYNGSYKLNKWITISEDLIWQNNSSRSINTSSGYTGAVLSAIYMPASATVYNPLDGSYGGTTTEDPDYIATYGSNYADAHGDAVNPVRLLEAYNLFNRTSDVWTTTSLEIGNIIPGLKFVSRFTYNVATNHYKRFTPIRDEVGKPDLSNTLNNSTYRTDQWKTENTLTYDTSVGKHNLGFLLSTTADHYNVRGLDVYGYDLADESDYLQYLAFASTTTASDYLTGPDANVAFIGRAAWSYDDRYFLTASWRRDYAGRLPKDHNHGDFPAVTAAWKVSNETIWTKNETVNLLKLRASWGRVGNLGSIPMNYKSALLGSSNWPTDAAQYGIMNGTTFGYFVYNNLALNNSLTWETSEQFDFGVDLEMFNHRLGLGIDWFEKRTFDLIQTQSMGWPTTMGIDEPYVNLGEVRNRGLEIQATWNDRINKDWSYFVSGNFAWLKNWVSDIGYTDDEGNKGVWTGDGSFRTLPYIYQTAEGEPLGSFYLIKTDGIFQSDAEAAAYVDANGNRIQPNAVAGDLKFVDYNGDGTIDDGDRQYCGSATPKTTFSFSAGFTWKKLSVSAMLQGVGGAQAFFAGKLMTFSDVEGSFNRTTDILDAWSTSNTGSNIPRLSKNDPNGNFSTASDWYLEDASYLRLKNLTISYDLTDAIRTWAHLKDRGSRLSVFFSGENLFTITDYSGMDPECGGWDAYKYPVSRVLSLGVKLTY